ncbi:MAG: hypothetical protein NTV84_10465, partial [Methanoregula sp.]|nr:hypothetical protein [Methanoregula sp.]
MNDRSLILFIVGFIFVSLLSLHLGAVYLPASEPAVYSETNTTPSSTLLSYADLFNSRDTEAIPFLVTRSKRRISENVSIEEVLADHFIRNIRIDKIQMGLSPVFSSEGIVADIA